MAKKTTIFNQLIFSVTIPILVASIILGVVTSRHTRGILLKSYEEKNRIISKEILKVMEFQDVALDVLEENLDRFMREKSQQIVDVLSREKNLAEVDLSKLRDDLGLVKGMHDLYLINKKGQIINTTFRKDFGLNLFNFGKEHEDYLKSVFETEEYVSDRFAIESKTRRLKKYSYQSLKAGEYVLEIGAYSERADEIVNFIKTTKREIAEQEESIVSVELFIGADTPFSLDPGAEHIKAHDEILKMRFKEKDEFRLMEKRDGQRIFYDYIYNERSNSDLYKGSVIRIVSDRTAEYVMVRNEIIRFVLVLAVALFILVLLIYRKTRIITHPIVKLVGNVKRITGGDMHERADVIGNNEIADLSNHFNLMIAELESYYHELEDKVRERTIEIQQQKEEIEAQRDALEAQRDILEEQKKHITDSIRYAQRIQNAMLPAEGYVKEVLPDSFVYFLPKDIVSGDFYWVNNKNNKVLFSAVDCTGHGVPGAFMSIVGNNHLNQAVNVFGKERPSEILDLLNENVKKYLQQNNKDVKVRDGMDLALCSIDYEKMKLEYAGAYNPLYLVRNNEVVQIKGNKFPIGAHTNHEISFKNHEIDLERGDVIYIFSDGFADQFGGPEKRKFLIKKFRELLLEIHPRSMDEQREILDITLKAWKGELEQVDDVLVMGVRV